jgi:hypothetical protein
MSKSNLRARPVYHRKRDSIEGHLTSVFAALAATRFIEDRTGWSIRKFVRTTRRYRTIKIRAGCPRTRYRLISATHSSSSSRQDEVRTSLIKVRSPAIRSVSSGVSFEAPFGSRRAGTSPATPRAASA